MRCVFGCKGADEVVWLRLLMRLLQRRAQWCSVVATRGAPLLAMSLRVVVDAAAASAASARPSSMLPCV